MTRLTRFRFALLLLGLVAGCTPDRSLPRIRVSFSPHPSWGPLMIAQAEGHFRDEGLDVEMVPAMRSEETLIALVAGDIDVRPGPLNTAFLSAIHRGAPIRIVAGMGTLPPDGCTYFGITLRPGIDPAMQDAVRRIRVSRDGASRFLTTRMLAARGLSLDSFETVRLPEGAEIPAMASGAIDAVAGTEPSLTLLGRSGSLWLSAQDAVPDFQWGVIGFGERLLTREPELGRRFLRAYLRGVARIREGKTERNLAILADATGIPADLVREACWPEFTAEARVNWTSVAAFQAWAVKEGLMEDTIARSAAIDTLPLASVAGGRGVGVPITRVR
jgi:ABC-type nitrate/sulfonate/bicarbonate transport system substrate-binding protein